MLEKTVCFHSDDKYKDREQKSSYSGMLYLMVNVERVQVLVTPNPAVIKLKIVPGKNYQWRFNQGRKFLEEATHLHGLKRFLLWLLISCQEKKIVNYAVAIVFYIPISKVWVLHFKKILLIKCIFNKIFLMFLFKNSNNMPQQGEKKNSYAWRYPPFTFLF